MKKHFLSLLAAVAFFASACSGGSDEAVVTDPVAPDSGEAATQKPVIIARTGLNGTRTSLGPDGKKVLWNEGDNIAVFLKNDHLEPYLLSKGEGTSAGQFQPVIFGEYTPGEFKNYVAVYPLARYSIQENSDKTGYLIGGVFNKYQYYRDDNPCYIPGNMIAVSENPSNLKFKNLCGLLKLSFTTDYDKMTIKKISVKGRNFETLSGNFEVNVGNDGEFSDVKFSEDMNNYISLQCDSGVNLVKGKYVDFYISMMPMNFKYGLQLEIFTDMGIYHMLTKGVNIKHSDILVMPKRELSIIQPLTELDVLVIEDAF